MTTGPEPESPTTTPFVLHEVQAAFRLGLSVDELRENAGPEGERWARVGGRVLWSEKGVAEVLASLVKTTENERLEPVQVALETLKVTWNRSKNRRVLEAARQGGEVVTVWVPNNNLFEVDMLLLAEKRPGGAVYDFRGDPARPTAGYVLPRRRGIW